MNMFNSTPFLWRRKPIGSFWTIFDPLGISVTVKFRSNYSSEFFHHKSNSSTLELHIHGILQYALQCVSLSWFTITMTFVHAVVTVTWCSLFMKMRSCSTFTYYISVLYMVYPIFFSLQVYWLFIAFNL